MRKKGIIVTMLALLIILYAFSSFASDSFIAKQTVIPEAEDLPLQEALKIAQELAGERRKASLDEMTNDILKANLVEWNGRERAWVITMFEQVFQNPLDISVAISSPSGEVISIDETNIGYFKEIKERWEKQLGKYSTWTLENKALFDRLYTVHDDHVVPDENMVTQDEATKIALRELPDNIQNAEFEYNLLYNASSYLEKEKYIWIVTAIKDGKKLFQVTVSALDGTVIDRIDLQKGNG